MSTKAQRLLLATVMVLILMASLFCIASCKEKGGPEDDTTVTVATDTEGSATPTETPEQATDTEPEQTVQEKTEADTTAPEPVTAGPNDIICRNPDIVYTYSDEAYAALNGKVDTLTALLSDNDPEKQEEFLTLYSEVEEEDFAVLTDQYLIANVLSMVYAGDEDKSACFESVSQMYNDVLQHLIMLYDDIDASVYADAFFEGWAEEERKQAVAMAGTYTDELKQLRVSYDELKMEYYKLPQDDTYMAATAEIYMRAVKINKQIATLCGYEDYMTYAYSLGYDRDYTPADVEQMKAYVKKYIVPQLNLLWNQISSMMEKMPTEDYRAFITYMTSDLPREN